MLVNMNNYRTHVSYNRVFYRKNTYVAKNSFHFIFRSLYVNGVATAW